MPADPATLRCLECDSIVGVKMESSRTCYHWDGSADSPDNPNRPIPLCRDCAEEHHAHWDYMWRDYYAGRM